MSVRERYDVRHLILVLSLLAFAALACIVYVEPAWLRVVDVPVALLIAPYQTYPVIVFFLALTTLGSGLGITVAILGILWCIRGQRKNAEELLVGTAGVALTVGVIKILIARARPETLLWLSPLTTYSFPSGHTAFATIVYGFVALLAHREIRDTKLRRGVVCLSLGVILLVSLSRLFLNAHFLSDVIGGMLIAVSWLAYVRIVGGRRTLKR